jgi:hypothetical protein
VSSRSEAYSVLKCAGVALFLMLLAFYAVSGWVRVVDSRRPAEWDYHALYFCGVPPPIPLALVAIATAVFWWRDAKRDIPPGHCRKCGYNLTGNVSGRCPECGAPTPPDHAR